MSTEPSDKIPAGCVFNLLSNATCARGSFRCDRTHRQDRRQWTLDNVYTIARRRLASMERNAQDIDALIVSERAAWGHVLRLCEQMGCQGRGVLRDNGGAVTGADDADLR